MLPRPVSFMSNSTKSWTRCKIYGAYKKPQMAEEPAKAPLLKLPQLDNIAAVPPQGQNGRTNSSSAVKSETVTSSKISKSPSSFALTRAKSATTLQPAGNEPPAAEKGEGGGGGGGGPSPVRRRPLRRRKSGDFSLPVRYKYVVVPGNNSRAVLAAFRRRPWWGPARKDGEESVVPGRQRRGSTGRRGSHVKAEKGRHEGYGKGFNLWWEMYASKPIIESVNQDVNLRQAVNHFEFNSTLVSKKGLYQSLTKFCAVGGGSGTINSMENIVPRTFYLVGGAAHDSSDGNATSNEEGEGQRTSSGESTLYSSEDDRDEFLVFCCTMDVRRLTHPPIVVDSNVTRKNARFEDDTLSGFLERAVSPPLPPPSRSRDEAGGDDNARPRKCIKGKPVDQEPDVAQPDRHSSDETNEGSRWVMSAPSETRSTSEENGCSRKRRPPAVSRRVIAGVGSRGQHGMSTNQRSNPTADDENTNIECSNGSRVEQPSSSEASSSAIKKNLPQEAERGNDRDRLSKGRLEGRGSKQAGAPTWVVKPAANSNCGFGIQVCCSLKEVLDVVDQRGRRAGRSGWIVQRYIERPLLVRGRKFDIRLFVLLVADPSTRLWRRRSSLAKKCSGTGSKIGLRVSPGPMRNHSSGVHTRGSLVAESGVVLRTVSGTVSGTDRNSAQGPQSGAGLGTESYSKGGGLDEDIRESGFTGRENLGSGGHGRIGKDETGRGMKEGVGPCPLTAWCHRDAYVRMSSVKYSNDPEKVTDRFVHLTNDAVQRRSPTYGKEEAGNKLTLEDLQARLDGDQSKHKGKANRWVEKSLRPRMHALVATSVAAAAAAGINKRGRPYAFELLGYDFMVDDDLKVWLIEVNSNPCLEFVCPTLEDIIVRVIDDTLSVALDPNFRPPAKHRTPSSSTGGVEATPLRGAVGDGNCGGFSRVYPIIR